MDIKNLPNKIPVFPLSNAVFFPKTVLPLNIFEDRYIQLVNDCMKGQRIFGMIQPKSKEGLKKEVYEVGCLGKITSFSETNDKRLIVGLTGLTRFRIVNEINGEKLYREFEVDYSDFANDLENKVSERENFHLKNILNKIKIYFEKKNYMIHFNELEKLSCDELISTISMISPFSSGEKQKIIETVNIEEKIRVFEEVINFNLIERSFNKTIQ